MKKALLLLVIVLVGCNSNKTAEIRSITDGEHIIRYTSLKDAENQIYEYEYEKYENTGERSWKLFKELIINDPRAFDYSFPKLSEDLLFIEIAYTPDKKLKFYSWDESSGTMFNYTGMTTFKIGNKTITDTTSNIKYCITDTYQVKDKNGDNIYLVMSYSQDYGECRYQTISAYKIINSRIVRADVFEEDWQMTSRITMNYNRKTYFANIEYIDGLLYIPETKKSYNSYDSADICTGRSHKFEWNGIYFENLGTVCSQNYELNTKLQNFKENIIHITLGKWIVRIDKMPNGDYRYSAWRSSSSTTSEPSLILYNGSNYSYGNYHEFRFTNYAYEYIVSWYDYGYYNNPTLVVTQNGEVILTATE